jgi:hypothetical protein
LMLLLGVLLVAMLFHQVHGLDPHQDALCSS